MNAWKLLLLFRPETCVLFLQQSQVTCSSAYKILRNPISHNHVSTYWLSHIEMCLQSRRCTSSCSSWKSYKISLSPFWQRTDRQNVDGEENNPAFSTCSRTLPTRCWWYLWNQRLLLSRIWSKSTVWGFGCWTFIVSENFHGPLLLLQLPLEPESHFPHWKWFAIDSGDWCLLLLSQW